VLVAVAIGAAVLADREEPSFVAQARNLTDDDAGFGSARESAGTLSRVSDLLAAQAERCEARRDADDPSAAASCRPYFAAAAYARIASVGVRRCSRPELFDARQAMDRYLATLEAAPEAASVPPPPRCA
jgi:hypothetical protein